MVGGEYVGAQERRVFEELLGMVSACGPFWRRDLS
jgi:hypothetical protein